MVLSKDKVAWIRSFKIKVEKIKERYNNRAMCDLIDCVLCGERQKEKTFVIKKEIDGLPCEIKLELSRQICEGCFIEGTVREIVNNKSLKLDLKPYQERFIKEWWEKSDLNQEDFMEMHEAFLFLEKKRLSFLSDSNIVSTCF